jgi:hypothetical protein
MNFSAFRPCLHVGAWELEQQTCDGMHRRAPCSSSHGATSSIGIALASSWYSCFPGAFNVIWFSYFWIHSCRTHVCWSYSHNDRATQKAYRDTKRTRVLCVVSVACMYPQRDALQVRRPKKQNARSQVNICSKDFRDMMDIALPGRQCSAIPPWLSRRGNSRYLLVCSVPVLHKFGRNLEPNSRHSCYCMYIA